MLSRAAARWLQAHPGDLLASLRATAALWSASPTAQLPAVVGNSLKFGTAASSSEQEPQQPQQPQQHAAQPPPRQRHIPRAASIRRQPAEPPQHRGFDVTQKALAQRLKVADSCRELARLLVAQRSLVSSRHVEVALRCMGRLLRKPYAAGPPPADREAFLGACEVLFGLLEQEARQLSLRRAAGVLRACAAARLPLPTPQAATLEAHLLASLAEEAGRASGDSSHGDGSIQDSSGGGADRGSRSGRPEGRPRALVRLLEALVDAEHHPSPPLAAALRAALLRGLPHADASSVSCMLSCSRKLRLLPDGELLQAFVDFARDRLGAAPHDVACAFAPRLLLALQLQGWTFESAPAEQQAVVAAQQELLLAEVEGLQAAGQGKRPLKGVELRNKLGTLSHWMHLTAAVGFTPEQRVLDAACSYLQQHEGQLSQRQLGWLAGALRKWGHTQHGLQRLSADAQAAAAQQQLAAQPLLTAVA